MNLIGKIFVALIMVFSVIYMGVATEIFLNAKDYRAKYDAKEAELRKAQSEIANLTSDVTNARKSADATKASLEADLDGLTKQVADQTARVASIEAERKDAVTRLESVQQALAAAQREAEYRIEESRVARESLKRTQDEANDLKIEQTNLLAQIASLEKNLATANAQLKTLREDNTAYAAFLRNKGFNDDIASIRGVSAPPKVEGIVLRVASNNRDVEISIGSNDGLLPGHKLFVYRVSPRPEYLGEIRIRETDPDQSTAVVEGGRTVQGKKLQEGDIVTSTFPTGI